MPLKPSRYRRQKVRHDRAFVELNRRRHWLGRYGTAESHQRYAQFVAEWQATGGHLADDKDKLTISQLARRVRRARTRGLPSC